MEFLNKYFTKAWLLKRSIYFSISFFFAISLSLICYLCIIYNAPQTTNLDDFIHINVVVNEGIAFSSLKDNGVVTINIVQSVLFIGTLIVAFFVPLQCSLIPATLGFISAGGLFNIIDRAWDMPNLKLKDGNVIVKQAAVLDYFQFNISWFSYIFNMPDVTILTGTICTALLVIFYTFYMRTSYIKLNNVKLYQPIKLFIDATQKDLYLAIFQEQVCIYVIIPTNNNLTDIIVSYISNLLKHANIQNNSISDIFYVNGPGSYTGIRVGAIITKTWKIYNEKIKVHTLSSLEFQSDCGKNSLSLIDAKGKRSYYMLFDKNRTEGIISNSEIDKFIEKHNVNTKIENYENLDVFRQLLIKEKDFKVCKNYQDIDTNYIKPALENLNNSSK